MIAASIIMIAGLALVALLSQTRGYRLGGVIVLPLLVIYTFREPLSLIIFILGTGAAWLSLWALREYTLNYGRRLFLIAVTVGAVTTILVEFVIALLLPSRLPFESAEMIASIFPGITAYNLMRLDPENRRPDLLAMTGGYITLIGVGILSLWIIASVETPTPPVLALPTSDLIYWAGIEPHGATHQTITPNWLSVTLLITDVIIYEFFRKRYDHRLAGIILIPLLAVFSVRYAPAVIVYAIGATAIFFLISYVHWTTILYGRVLLAIALILGTIYTLIIGILQPASAPGITLFFIGLFVGIGAYNLHRAAPKNRPAHIRISAALFVVFYAILFTVLEIPTTGLAHTHLIPYALLGVIVLTLAAIELYRLEQSIPDATAFARESVFANAALDEANLRDSPLVADTQEDDE